MNKLIGRINCGKRQLSSPQRTQRRTEFFVSIHICSICHSEHSSVVSTRHTTYIKTSSAYNKKMINLLKNFLFHCKKIIFALEMYISRLEIYISKLKICISRLKMNFSAYSEHPYP